jgi:hypothetical protein
MTRYRRWDGVAVLAAAAAIGLTACSGTSAPHVANLGRSRGGDIAASTSTVPAGSPTQLLDKWASCMRSHGDPNQVDPTVDATKVIQVTLPAGYAGGLRGGSGACGSYLSAAETALGGGTPTASSSDATGLRFARCMRANGVPSYPDPTGNGNSQAVHVSSGSDLNPANPTFQAASTLCTHKTGFQNKFSSGPPQPGSINVNMAGGFGGKPGGNGGPGANSGG